MELWREIWGNNREDFEIMSPETKEKFYLYCYQALQEIRDIVRDGALDDRECFEKIEEIVCIFEKMGSHGGSRHDFG